jgi:uncharacterized protein (DUF697 family)
MTSPDFFHTVHRVLEDDLGSATAEERDRCVRDLVTLASAASAAITLQPIPLLDVALLAPVQIAMVQGIAKVHGYAVDRRTVVEWIGTFGASILTRHLLLAAAKLVPFAGWLAGASMAYALTHALGEVSDHYFRSGRGVPSSELQQMFKNAYARSKAEKDTRARTDDSLEARLRRLTEAFAAGLLTEEEFRAKKEDILRGF